MTAQAGRVLGPRLRGRCPDCGRDLCGRAEGAGKTHVVLPRHVRDPRGRPPVLCLPPDGRRRRVVPRLPGA